MTEKRRKGMGIGRPPTGLVNKKRLVSSGSLTVTEPLLSAYFREVQKYPLLDRAEERRLAIQYRATKDRGVLQRLVTSNLRFVVKIAYEYAHYRMRLLDLIQEGNMGLVKAVQEFDPYKEVRLTTYAVWWIRSYIQDAILKNHSLVKIGTTQAQKKLFYRLRREQRALEQAGLSQDQTVKLLAEKLDVSPKEIEEMNVRLGAGDLSLNAPVHEEGKKDHLQNLSDLSAPVDEQLGNQEQRVLFHKILKQFGEKLEGREKVIFSDRLISETPLTLQEIGDKYGVTKERARQLEEQVKEKLRAYMKEHYPDYDMLSSPE
jgi:RNA polymerase sigma-32 factor